MILKPVTIEAVYVGEDDVDDLKDYTIRTSLNIDISGMPKFTGYVTGVRGTPSFVGGDDDIESQYDCYPFVVNDKGNVDFGSAYQGDGRNGSTNLLNKKIEVGETFNLTEGGEENTYKIRRVIRPD